MTMFRYQIMVDEESKRMIEDIPKYERSAFFREILAEKRNKDREAAIEKESKKVKIVI